MFQTSFFENAFFQPFVFKMFLTSYILSCGKLEAAMQSVGSKASWWGVTLIRSAIINSFLFRVSGDLANDRVKSSAGILLCRPPARPDRRRSAPSSYAYWPVIVKSIIDG